MLRVGKCQSKPIEKSKKNEVKNEIDNVEVSDIVSPLPAQKTSHNRVCYEVRVTVVIKDTS